MAKRPYEDVPTENLIYSLCRLYDNTHKYTRADEKRIAKELEKRGIINAEKFIEMLNE